MTADDGALEGALEGALLGILVGGASRRMQGRAKGRLLSPLSLKPIVEHLVEEGARAGLTPVLIGEASAYRDLAPDVPRIDDVPDVKGPLAGMIALAEYAEERHVLTVGCDMPFISLPALQELLRFEPNAACVCVRTGDRWEPFFARWSGPTLLAAGNQVVEGAGTFRLQELFEGHPVAELPQTEVVAKALCDWDQPSDLSAGRAEEPD